jgi:oxygen-independent coproporphyrinogen-3 oxidase
MFGVYVHFPYCRRLCPYCDFAVAVRRSIPQARYEQAVLAELCARAPLFAGRRAVSVYFGGGTPSLWDAAHIDAVRAAALRAFPPPPGVDPEVTVECDPKDLDLAGLRALRQAGVTRLSLGVQSFSDRHLAQLGRLHRADEARAAIALAGEAGFDNLSVDLMIGLCGQTRAELDADLAEIVAAAPAHVSLYQLTVEPRTRLFLAVRDGKARLPDADTQAEFYTRVGEALGGAGYEHYEISSYARPGRRAVHNRLYWTGGEYLGLGVSAHSFRRLQDGAGERLANPRATAAYLRLRWEASPAPDFQETLPREALAREALWLGLRQIDGLSRRRFAAQHGLDPLALRGPEIERLVRRGLLEVGGDSLRLTPPGVLLADEVGAALL